MENRQVRRTFAVSPSELDWRCLETLNEAATQVTTMISVDACASGVASLDGELFPPDREDDFSGLNVATVSPYTV
jgi:hypothetical protein